MLTGSTSAFRFLSTLSLQPQCKLLWDPAVFVRSRFATLASPLRSRTFSTSRHPQSILEERNRPSRHDAVTMMSHQGLPCSSRTPVPSCTPALSAYKNSVSHLVGTDPSSDVQNGQRHGRVSRILWPRRSLDHTKRKCPSQKRRTLLWVILTAKTPDRAWAAYEKLLSYQVAIPRHLLHQLARLLASVKPRTRTVHFQLLSVLKTLEMSRGQLRLWEWNTLIDSVGKQWHKTRLEDYENSLDIFNKRGVLPGGNTTCINGTVDAEASSCVTQQNPDIWTYNILLSIAGRSNLPLAVRHATSLLHSSGLTPNRYTYLCLIRYFAVQNDLRNVRSTLRKMKQQGLEVGLDGINTCLWAYARSGRFDVALRIYRVLRSNVKPAPDSGEHNIEEDACYIHDVVGLDNLDRFEPDEVTYTMMIQALAYHGNLRNALSTFIDMLSTPNREAAIPTDDTTIDPACYKPSMATFRALFLGFARHAQDPEHRTIEEESTGLLFPSSQVVWDLDNLEAIFTAFLQLPSLPKPTDRVVYWILVAFDKTSGRDPAKLREVWNKLEVKYGDGWGGRLEEIRRSIFRDQQT